MPKFKLLLGCLLASTLSSCSSETKTVKDSWLGVDEITLTDSKGAQTLSGAFNLRSKLTLPKIGKGVSYKITTTCHRVPTQDSKKQKSYSKTLSYKADQSAYLKPLAVIDHLPETVLVFPEFFKTCDITFFATNQHGSTAGSELLDQVFKFQNAQLDITVAPFDLDPNISKYPFAKTHLKNIRFRSKNKQTLYHSKLLCFSNALTTSNIQEAGSKVISGALFKLPKPNLEVPVENCIVKAANSSGDIQISNRIKFLNGLDHESTHTDVIYSLTDEKKQIFYSGSQNKKHKLFTFSIQNYSDAELNYKFGKGIGKDFIKTLTKLKKSELITNGPLHSIYSMVLKDLPATFFWERQDREMLDNSFSLKPQEEGIFSFYLEQNFICKDYLNESFTESEIGFVVALDTKSDLLQVEQTSTNEFTTDVISAGNLFETQYLRGLIPSNLPDLSPDFLKNTSSFQMFFRNKERAKGKPLVLSYNQKYKAVQGQNGEYDEKKLLEQGTGYYPFITYVTKPKPDNCSALD